MTAEQAIRYIENYGWSTTRLGLGRTRQLLEALGNPEKKLKFIHVAGSNGKGSTCAMFDSILRQAGYRCGLYISPYIEDFCERIQINGIPIPGGDLARITERVMELAEKMEDHPSQFELVTAIAMVYFYEEQCDIVVLEVGMGGELDSTNVIEAPELACITNIGLEHTEYLGDTLEEIAQTKAGIIKTGCSCVCYNGAAEVTKVIEAVCRERNVPFYLADDSRLRFVKGDLNGQTIFWDEKPLDLALIGTHQLHNAALVLTGVEVLRQKGYQIEDHAVAEGLRQVQWPARLEVLSRNPVVILDGGHNPQCAQALTESLQMLLPERKVVFLCGVLRDKDYGQITDLMIPFAEEFVCVTPLSGRALHAEELALFLQEKGCKAAYENSIEEGIAEALVRGMSLDAPVVIFGSLYLAGAVRKAFPRIFRDVLRRQKMKARRSMDPEKRAIYSERIARRILTSDLYQGAQTILIYQAVKGEVSLEAFRQKALADGKTLCYPRCLDQETMTALCPDDPDQFEKGRSGILEPVPEYSSTVSPQQIDLVICPGTVFDANGSRLGMGAGYYDRYLKQLHHAALCGAAFEVQLTDRIPAEQWDVPMHRIYTEDRVIVCS